MKTIDKHYYNPSICAVDISVSLNIMARKSGTFAGFEPKTLVNAFNVLAACRKTKRPAMMFEHHAGLTNRTEGFDMADITHKVCPNCKQTLPLDAFRIYRAKPYYYCRPCERAKGREWRAKNPGYRSPTLRSWESMKQRCFNPNQTSYKYYGGRGITVCERWMVFDNFLADMGARPEGTSLERVDNDKGYCKENCKWATPHEQALNKRLSKTNSTGIRGVCYSKTNGYWQATAGFKGKRYCLYNGPCKETAIAARLKFDREVKGIGHDCPHPCEGATHIATARKS